MRLCLICSGYSTKVPSLNYKFYIALYEKENICKIYDDNPCKELVKNCKLLEVSDNPMLLKIKIQNPINQAKVMAHFGWHPVNDNILKSELVIRKSTALGTKKSYIYDSSFKYKITGHILIKKYELNEEILHYG